MPIAGNIARIGGNLMGGLGNLVAPTMPGIDPAEQQALRNQAMLNLGLGLMAGRESGLGFGQSGLGAMKSASSMYMPAMRSAFRQRLAQKEMDQREKEQDFREQVAKREDQRWMYEQKQAADERSAAVDRWQKEFDLNRGRIGSEVAGQREQTAQMAAARAFATEVFKRKAAGYQVSDEDWQFALQWGGYRAPYNPMGMFGGMGLGNPAAAGGSGAAVNPLLSDPSL